jgi:CRP/FNR family transcriptional regulator
MPVMPRARVSKVEPAMTVDDAVDRVPLLRALNRGQIDALRPLVEMRRIAAGARIWATDEPTREFLFVVDGHAKLIRPREDGREVILDIRGPGDLLCAGAVSSFAPYCCTAQALDAELLLIAIPRRELHRVLEENGSVAAVFVHQLTSHEMRLTDRIVELASGQVERRIAALLLRLADQVGRPDPGRGIRIRVKLSRQDLADLCGTTLETAIRTMTRLARDEIVDTLPSGFVIRDRARLEQLAKGS